MTEVQITIKVPSENVSVSSGHTDSNNGAPAPEPIEQIQSSSMRSDADGPPPSMLESSGGGGEEAESSGLPKPEPIEDVKSKKKSKK